MNAHVSSVSTTNLIDAAASQGSFGILRKALDAADLTDVLKGSGPYTVFAPTDEAFNKLPKGTLENWLKPENKAQLIAVMKYHVMPGRASTTEVGNLSNPKMLQGDSAHISKRDNKLTINDARLLGDDIATSNGIIHSIDAVLQPKQATKH